MDDVHEVTELITPGPAQALAGLLGVPAAEGELPLLWHWVYLLDRPPQDALGPDGHQHRGGMPVPPGPGLRRMFAGGRAWRHGALRIGSEATRRTWQASSVRKQGRSGPLHFVTVRTEVSQGGQVVITEEQDLVYREPGRMARPVRPKAWRRPPGPDGHGGPGPAVPVLRADLQRAPDPLRPPVRAVRGLPRPGRARPAAGLADGRTGRAGRVRVRVPAGRAAVRGPGPDRVGRSGRRRGSGCRAATPRTASPPPG